MLCSWRANIFQTEMTMDYLELLIKYDPWKQAEMGQWQQHFDTL